MSDPIRELTYPDLARAYLMRFRETSPAARYRSDREAWSVLDLAIGDLRECCRSLRGRPMVDGRPFRDGLVRLGAESWRAAEDLGHDLGGRFPEMAGAEHERLRPGFPPVPSALHLLGILGPAFAYFGPAIQRAEFAACRKPRDPINLAALNEPADFRPIDLYLAFYVYSWIGAEHLLLVRAAAADQARPSR